MKKTLQLLLATAVLLSTHARLARAGGEASLYLGRSSASSLRLEPMTTFGGTIGAYSGLVGAELGLEYSPASNFQIGPIDSGASLLGFMGNFVFQIPFGGLIPYATVGYGVIRGSTDVDVPEGFVGTVKALNFGLGGRLYVSERMGVRVDYRRFALQTADDAPELVIPLTGIRVDTNPDIDRFTAGVSFRW